MKIVINKTGKVEEVRQREADRLVNRGKAHLLPEIPFSDYVPTKKEIKVIEEYSGKAKWPIKVPLEKIKIKVGEVRELAEPVKEVVTDVDLIKPIPERFTSFEESKPKRKRKKKNKFEKWND